MRKATVEQPAAKPGQSKPCRHPAKSVAQWRKSWPTSLCAPLPPSQPKTWALTTQPACGNGIRNAEPCPGQHAAPTGHRRHNSAVPRQRSRRHGRRESECRLQPLHRRAAAGTHTASGRAGWKRPKPRRASGAGSCNNTADANGQVDSNRGQTKGAADFRSAGTLQNRQTRRQLTTAPTLQRPSQGSEYAASASLTPEAGRANHNRTRPN